MKSVHHELGPMAAGGNTTSKLLPNVTVCCAETSSLPDIAHKGEAQNPGFSESHPRHGMKSGKPPKYISKCNCPRRPSAKRTRKNAAMRGATPVHGKVGGNEPKIERSAADFCSPISEEPMEFSIPKAEPESDSGPFLETALSADAANKQGLRANQREDSSNTSDFQAHFAELGFALPPAVLHEREEDSMVPEFEVHSCQKPSLNDPFAEYSILEIIDPSNRSG
jgi:hypothetical protein